MATRSIGAGAMAALSGPAVPMFALMMPLVIFIPPFYAEHMGLGMAAVGTIFTVGRLFDVVTDPVAGVVMDKTRHMIPKQAWVLIGAIPLSIATWQIFFAQAPGDTATLMTWLIILYAGWTFMSVGLFSWASEVTDDYHERSRVMGAVQMANAVGMIMVLLIPAVIELMDIQADLDLLRVQAMGGTILLLLPITLVIAWFYAPKAVSVQESESSAILPALKHAARNRVLRRLIVADFGVGLKIGIFTALTVFFVEIVLGLEGRAGLLQLTLLCSSLMGLPLFVYAAGKWGKHTTLAVTAALSALGGLLAMTIPPGSILWAIACYLIFGFSAGASQMLPRAIMADILDEETSIAGEQRTGLYFSFLTTTFKLGMGLGVGVTYGIAALVGFDPVTAREDSSTHWVITTMMGIAPLILATLISAMMWKFPLNKERLEQVRFAREAEAQISP